MESNGHHPDFATVLDVQNDECIVHVFGDVDMFCSPDFEAAIEEAAALDLRLLIDLRPCRYMDSTGLSVLVRTAKRHGGRVEVVLSGDSPLARVFEIAGLGEILSISVVKGNATGPILRPVS